jgi:ABC-type amino acid transport substrate-binding protein
LPQTRGFSTLYSGVNCSTVAKKLAAARIDAWGLTDILALWTWRRMGMPGTLTVGKPIKTSHVYIVAGLDFPADLAARFCEAIDATRADGTIERIIQRCQ